MEFSFDISALVWALMGLSVLCAVWLLTVYRGRVVAIAKRRRRCERAIMPEKAPGVSIIVYAIDNPTSLTALLDNLLQQEYDGETEIIIVNDGASEDVKDVYNLLSQTHRNLHQTFIPNGAHNLSRRKLAITLGVKGARYPYVLILDASSSIHSRRWLASMARHFAKGREVVLGYATVDNHRDERLGKRRRSLSWALDALTYLPAALSGHPYRGHAANMGFRRDKFLGIKGFSQSLNIHTGEDDILVSQIATGENTAVELSHASRVTMGGESPRAMHRRWKWHHLFTGQYVSKTARRMMGLHSGAMWIGFGSAVAASVIALPNFLPLAAMLAIGLGLWIALVVIYQPTLRALGARKLRLTLPYLLLTQPIYNAYYHIVARRHRGENFTWSAPKR